MIGRGALWATLALLVMGVLVVTLELESPSSLYFTGTEVQGYSQGGITYYSYEGVDYSADNPRQSASVTARVPTTVWFDPSNPSDALTNTTTRWLEAVGMGIWFVAALVVLVVGVIRHQLWKRSADAAGIL